MGFSARPLDYLLPSIDHPVLGHYVTASFQTPCMEATLSSRHCIWVLFNWTVHGWIFLCFINAKHPFGINMFSFLAPALYHLFFQCRRGFLLGNCKPTVSYFMYKIAPMFRVYARFVSWQTSSGVCCYSGVNWAVTAYATKTILLLLTILLSLLCFEYWSIPTHYARSIDPSPAVYHGSPKNRAIHHCGVSMMKSDEAAFIRIFFGSGSQ